MKPAIIINNHKYYHFKDDLFLEVGKRYFNLVIHTVAGFVMIANIGDNKAKTLTVSEMKLRTANRITDMEKENVVSHTLYKNFLFNKQLNEVLK